MSSGNFETLFFQKAVPLINNVTGYSTLTMFAVGNQGYLEGQSFYTYQSTCGFQDSSTLTTVLTASFNSSITSTIKQLNSTIAFIGKTYVSTIPMLQWISSQTIAEYPFYYNSTFITSNLPFVSTGVLAPSYPFDYVNNGIVEYGSNIIIPPVWLGPELSKLINTGNYTVYADVQYSLVLSTNTTSFMWLSTLGVFNQLDNPSYIYGNKGVSFTTRIGNYQCSHINTTMIYKPETPGFNTELPRNVSNFHLELYVNSNLLSIADPPAFDIFVPGTNNIKFTLVPLT